MSKQKRKAPAGGQRWAVWALAQGYPTCTRCFQPIPKADWKQYGRNGGLCHICEEQDTRLAELKRYHESMMKERRGY